MNNMLAITNLKPKDLDLIYHLLRDENLLGDPAYKNFVKELRVAIQSANKLTLFADKLWKK